ncbi:hypothetical protein BDQ94DRAFT_143511 [Aspergillus welwitschiae]|uniref:Uncharacterized protein n=1 Tax=Aspergillus welwitschiae TaxID=1341132 RepID=A0A3F3Q4M9_9EURO|nr:hypothetical protein BDQ94DRAFT_143511 [Aspergillus welwitschiae]RDH33656.1 hypothetical protein BDQ94DRAFT_143511 [Aspergillus welwitschiae]
MIGLRLVLGSSVLQLCTIGSPTVITPQLQSDYHICWKKTRGGYLTKTALLLLTLRRAYYLEYTMLHNARFHSCGAAVSNLVNILLY